MAEAEVAIVVSPRDWAERLHRFLADHGGARVRARVIDAREALDDTYAVLVVEDLTSFLTPRLIGELRARGRRVLGVHEADEPWARQRLVDLGVDTTITADATPEEFVRAIDTLAATVDVDAAFSRIVSEELATLAPVEAPGSAGGQVVAVGAPPGGCGATEVAIELAAAAARRGPVALVDADEFAPSVAQRLGMALHPNLRSAIDALEHRTGRVEDTLRPIAGTALDVLAGLPNGRDWHEVRASDVVAVVDELAATRGLVVANVGHGVEDLAAQGAPPRFAVTRAVLQRADRIIAVGTPTPVGIARLLDWIATVRVLAPLTRVDIVVNRAPAQRFKRAELADEIARSFTPGALVFTPDDRRVGDAAWDGTLVTSGRFSRAVERLLADTVVTTPALSARGSARGRRG